MKYGCECRVAAVAQNLKYEFESRVAGGVKYEIWMRMPGSVCGKI